MFSKIIKENIVEEKIVYELTCVHRSIWQHLVRPPAQPVVTACACGGEEKVAVSDRADRMDGWSGAGKQWDSVHRRADGAFINKIRPLKFHFTRPHAAKVTDGRLSAVLSWGQRSCRPEPLKAHQEPCKVMCTKHLSFPN